MSIPSARGPCASWQLTYKHWKYVTQSKRTILFILVWLKLNDDTIMLMGHNRMTNNLWWNTFWPTSVKNRNEYNKILSIFRKHILLVSIYPPVCISSPLLKDHLYNKSSCKIYYYLPLLFTSVLSWHMNHSANSIPKDYWKFWAK